MLGMGCVQINGEDGDGWAYGCSGVAASQGVAERHQILRCRFLFRGLFFLGLPLSNPILRLARTALCGRRTSRVQILASAMRREAWRRMLTEQARARAAAARVLVAGRSLALPKLLAPRAGHCFGWHQDHVVEWLAIRLRSPDARYPSNLRAQRERQVRAIALYCGAMGVRMRMAATKMSAPRRTTAEKQERPTSLVINRVQSTTLIASQCGGQVVQMHSWGASASRPSGGS